ncbi:hypothetical protein N7495_008517 [Penicillium taxi]|uniref:uncharacterized protein n=1 Tax=Penicillium taxi TaxID=168475 RepID=UPI002545011F|nr:uncharacterized protein N7495_008517 [Penicillium taxi]KAJ5888476.1 hypothetical protein N7495_008517 [Penicillium taxi]
MATEEDIAWFKSTFHDIPKPELPDDSVEYFIYYLPSPLPAVIDAASESRAKLSEVQRTAAEISKDLLKGYIWQRDGFKLEISKDDGIASLHGRTNYGDSIEDEWVIVYILRELTKRHKDIWVQVKDTDGEFLLIEAAGALPAWLEPEVADNRVWINQGDLKIIKPRQDNGKKTKKIKRVTEKLSLSDAHKIIQDEPTIFFHSTMIQEEAFYRLRNYPKQISENLHSAIVTIPRKVAFLLRQKPAYISPAVEALYIRDPIALRPLKAKDASKLIFKPDDMVTVSVRFTRVGYAQLKSQDFPAPTTWTGKVPIPDGSPAYNRAETGMKLACGFEMLLHDPQHQDKPSVREMKLLLEDVDTGDEELPTDTEIEKWDMREDDEKWLDISFEDLDRELKGKGKGTEGEADGDFGDMSAQENLQRIVARFEEFLNDTSAGPEGANFMDDDFDTDSDVSMDDEESSSDGEDKDGSFDEEEFTRMMKEMMGMPGFEQESNELVASMLDRIKEVGDEDGEDEDEEDDTEQIQELSRQMGAELQGTGVLDLNQKSQSGKGKKGKKGKNGKGGEVGEGEDGNDNINLAKNLLEALQGQAGTAGPAGSMLSMMNLPMPKHDQ